MYLLQDQRHYLLRAQRELRMGKAEEWAAAKNAENVRLHCRGMMEHVR